MKKIAQEILVNLKESGVQFADIRVHLSDEQENISTLNGDLNDYSMVKKSGYGIRVLYEGAWGFSSSEDQTKEGMSVCARHALDKAKASSSVNSLDVELAKKSIFKDSYSTQVEIDPLEVPAKDKISYFLSIDKKLRNEKFDFWSVYASFHRRHIFYIDTEGAEINRYLMEIDGGVNITAKDKDGHTQNRTSPLWLDANGTSGWEVFLSEKFDQAQRIHDEMLEIINAPVIEKEICDVILLNDMMALQTHETIGHALELDRILGYELSYAGGSHVELKHFGDLQFGSEKLTARADGTVLNSPGSIGYDDDGVKGRNVLMIEKGILKNAITSRQMIVEANKENGAPIFKESGGTCRAESYNSMPIERMNNINVDFGSDGNLSALISKVKNGILMDSPRSWSIGSNRENFHFTCEYGLKIIDGKISHLVRNPSYRGDSVKFWNSLKYVGDETTWKLMPVFNCGKGQPNQIMRLAHGVPVCVFENVQVGD